MDFTEIVERIDTEIARLQQARHILAGLEDARSAKAPTPTKRRRLLSPEARARIEAAQKARWAKAKKSK